MPVVHDVDRSREFQGNYRLVASANACELSCGRAEHESHDSRWGHFAYPAPAEPAAEARQHRALRNVRAADGASVCPRDSWRQTHLHSGGCRAERWRMGGGGCRAGCCRVDKNRRPPPSAGHRIGSRPGLAALCPAAFAPRAASPVAVASVSRVSLLHPQAVRRLRNGNRGRVRCRKMKPPHRRFRTQAFERIERRLRPVVGKPRHGGHIQ